MLSSLIGEYRGVFRFLKAYKKFWLIFTVITLVFSVAVYALVWNSLSADPEAVLTAIESMDELFTEKDSTITNESGDITAIGLFKNNILAMFVITMLGLFPFLFVPVFSLMVNIVIICITMAAGIAVGAFDSFGAFLLLAPHGIFELPALLMSSWLGTMLCGYASSRIVRYGERPSVAINHLALEISRTFVLVVVPLLIAASLIEAYITPALFSFLS